MTPALELRGLTVGYRRERIEPVVRDVSLTIAAGESYGLVGESGCGKSTIAMAAVRYLPDDGVVMGGQVLIHGHDIIPMDPSQLRGVRGRRVAVVFQDPRRALNPAMRIGAQVREALEVNGRATGRRAAAATLELLERVALTPAPTVARRYPHQLSGGQQQRVVIAMAVAASPPLLILDEPTSSLDATVEAGVVELLDGLRTERGCALLFISHDLGLVSRSCDRVGVLYAGRLVAEAPAREAFTRPAHPYVLGLARSTPGVDADGRPLTVRGIPGRVPPPRDLPPGCTFAPRCDLARRECDDEPPLRAIGPDVTSRCWFAEEVVGVPVRPPGSVAEDRVDDAATGAATDHAGTPSADLLVVEQVTKRFGAVVACDAVSLEVRRGETFGLVGESGSGKSTLGRCIVGLEAPDEGRITLSGRHLAALAGDRPADLGRSLQMVFQHPDSTLNPWRTIGAALGRARSRLGGTRSVDELLTDVGLDPQVRSRRPGRLSGGQRQRVAIARALAGAPELVVCDEPLSALDVSVQASVLELLVDVQRRTGLALLFISHDLAVVRQLAQTVGVMLGGQLLERGPTADVLRPPHHPYTEALVAAAANRPRAAERPADVSSAPAAHGLCPYRSRCPLRVEACSTTPAPVRDAGAGHQLRCHRELDDLAAQPDVGTRVDEPSPTTRSAEVT